MARLGVVTTWSSPSSRSGNTSDSKNERTHHHIKALALALILFAQALGYVRVVGIRKQFHASPGA